MILYCPECKVKMIRRLSFYLPKRYWWGCSNYPYCTITASEHPDGTMMSIPANKTLKKLKIEAHKLAEIIWGRWKDPRCKKKEMYDWLKVNTKKGHIGLMNEKEVIDVIKKLKSVAYPPIKIVKLE